MDNIKKKNSTKIQCKKIPNQVWESGCPNMYEP